MTDNIEEAAKSCAAYMSQSIKEATTINAGASILHNWNSPGPFEERIRSALEEDWSKEPPTEPGWYWCYCWITQSQYPVDIVVCTNSKSGLGIQGTGVDSGTVIELEVWKNGIWYWQKMNVPQPPKE